MRSVVASCIALLLSLVSLAAVQVAAFAPGSQIHRFASTIAPHVVSATKDNDEGEWTSLTDDGAVKIRTISSSSEDGSSPEAGDEVAVEYVGTIASRDWSAQDVVDAWLTEQQGLDALAPKLFIEFDIDGEKLMDDGFFTEQFVATALAVDNKIKCKKLCMAARNLKKAAEDHAVGTEFDNSKERGAFRFPLGKGKAIKAFELAILNMKRGDTAQILTRSDYAYGKEGMRRANGDVVVPPYATLCFDVTLLKE